MLWRYSRHLAISAQAYLNLCTSPIPFVSPLFVSNYSAFSNSSLNRTIIPIIIIIVIIDHRRRRLGNKLSRINHNAIVRRIDDIRVRIRVINSQKSHLANKFDKLN